MSDEDLDHLIDSQLRNVPVPADLAARLHEMAGWPDGELDRELGAVPVTPSLAMRLRDIPADLPLERELNDVSLPDRLNERLQGVPSQEAAARRRRRAWQALAAAVALLVLAGYAGLGRQKVDRTPAAGNQAMRPDSEFSFSTEPEQTIISADPAVVFQSAAEDHSDVLAKEELPDIEALMLPQRHESSSYPVPAVLAAAGQPAFERPVNQLRIVGAPPLAHDESPQLTLVRLPVARGIVAPLLPGYDRAFLLRTGFHPPVSPAGNEAMRQSIAPLSLATNSFDQAVAALQANQPLAPDQIRTEDFIAAVDHQLPLASPGELSLKIAVGPSRYGPPGARLIGLGVRAGDALHRENESAHLVMAIDFSASLAKAGHWPWVREAILKSLGRLSARDRLSLVFFQEEVVMASSPLGRDDVDLLRQRLAGAKPGGNVNVAAGLEAAFDLALTADVPVASRQVVVLTPGRFDLPAQFEERIRFVSQQAEDAGVHLHLADLSGSRNVSESPRLLSRLMRARQRPIDSRRQLIHGLLSLVNGEDALTASEARLSITFDPQSVAAYRLIGHEANAMSQLVAPASVAELRPGDEAMVLFEVLPNAVVEPKTVAHVELTWMEATTMKRHTLRRELGLAELMQPFDSGATAFRAAALASETAEHLRGSRSALREFGWHNREPVGLEELTSQARMLLSTGSAPSLKPLVDLLDKARVHRSK